jgi:hypothetical protein
VNSNTYSFKHIGSCEEEEALREVADTTEVVIGESSELDFAASRFVVGWAITC